MRSLLIFLLLFFINSSFGQVDTGPFDGGDRAYYSDRSLGHHGPADDDSDDESEGRRGLAQRVANLERLVEGIRNTTGCANLKFFPEVRYPIMVLDDNSGYPGPVSSFSAAVPEHVRCVELEVLAAIETDLPLVGTTTAGIMILNEVNGDFDPIATVKVLGRVGYECYENENTASITAPVIDGRVYYQLLNMYPSASDESTATGLVVSVVGYYGDW